MSTKPSAGLMKRFRRKVLSNWMLYLFVLPTLAYIVIFHYLPLYGIQIAFRNYKPARGIWGSDWVGFKYFIKFSVGIMMVSYGQDLPKIHAQHAHK